MIFGTKRTWFRGLAIFCATMLIPVQVPAQQAPAPAKPPATAAPAAAPADAPKPKTPDELDSLVAPIALYPDPLLAQVLAASTYPLEIVQCRRWMQANPKLKGDALTEAALKQPWDASVQALVMFPDALKVLDEGLQWTTDLGNAFLDQQSDVMDAVQRMRKKAKDGGKLESSKEQTVEVKTVETKTVIEIQPANPQVIYVPTYNPVVVYGPPVYAYPPIYYPPVGYYAATAAISFGVGMAMGAAWGGAWGGGWGCGWGNNEINIDNDINIDRGDRNTNINGGDRVNAGNRNNAGATNRAGGGGSSSWKHDPGHRQSVPYSSRDTAQKFGGSTRDASGGVQRFDSAGQQRPAQVNRGSAGGGNQAGNLAARPSNNQAGQVGSRDAANRGSTDRIGNQSVQNRNSASQRSALGGSQSRTGAQAASSRGMSSSRSVAPRGGGGGRRR